MVQISSLVADVSTDLGAKTGMKSVFIIRRACIVFLQAERQAINTTVQGSAADIVKIATVNVQKQLETFQSIFKSHGHREVMLQGDRTGLFMNVNYSMLRLIASGMKRRCILYIISQ